MATVFRYAADRDPWDRQLGESGEEHDWWLHWRGDGHRRTYARTAERFEVRRDRVARVAKRNRWADRLIAWKQHNSDQVRERFEDLIEASLVPFAQGIARMAAHAVTAPTEKIPADRALVAATAALRVVKEPDVRDLIRLSHAQTGQDINLAHLILDTLAARFPEAHDQVLDAIEHAATGDGS